MTSTEVASLLDTLHKHLDHVQHDATVPLNERMLDEAGYFVVPPLQHRPQERAALISHISRILPQLAQRPQPLIRLLSLLVRPYSFDDIVAMQPPIDFVAGLGIEAEPYNLLMLSLIRKAGTDSAGVARLANIPAVVKALVNLWLLAPDMGIAEEASNTLLALLATDQEHTIVSTHGIGDASPTPGHKSGSGLLWRRFFGDRDIYGLLFALCGRASNASNLSVSVNSKQKSLAQARLLAITPGLGKMDWSCLVQSHHQDVERNYGLSPDEGLLDFIAIHMIDFRKDVLLHVNLIKLFSDILVHVQRPSNQRHITTALQYLQDHGLHDRTLAHWLKPDIASADPLDKTFLYGPAAQYLSAYASKCPTALLQDGAIRQTDEGLYSILRRLCDTLSMSASRWAHGESVRHDLNVLVSLPRVSLLPQSQLGTGRGSSPLLLVPCKNTNADALNTLARVFHGSVLQDTSDGADSISTLPTEEQKQEDSDPHIEDSDSASTAEAAASRALFTLYLRHHPTLFVDVVAHATTVALPDKAIAATNLIASIATASWAPLPSENAYDPMHSPTSTAALPSQSTLASLLPADPSGKIAYPTANTGIGALLQSPAREAVFPFLLSPAQSFSNLMGGRGDAESSAYKVAVAKADCLEVVQKALTGFMHNGSEEQNVDGLQEIMAAVDRRAREGIWGAGGGTEVGGRIATMEL